MSKEVISQSQSCFQLFTGFYYFAKKKMISLRYGQYSSHIKALSPCTSINFVMHRFYFRCVDITFKFTRLLTISRLW